MKKSTIALFCASTLAFSSCKEEQKTVVLDSDSKKVSYGIGIDIANNLKNGQVDTLVNVDALVRGLQDAFDSSATYLMDPQEATDFVHNYFMQMQEKQRRTELEKYLPNKEEGEKFLEENKTKDGVQVTETGLQYKVIKKGWGKQPTSEETVKVHYKGTLIDGTVFDSSYDRGQPATFGVSQVIPGWTEVLQLMKVGAKYEVYIPQELAYGESPRPGGPIKPYSTLIFEVELLNIEK